jgi:hypothetical protein
MKSLMAENSKLRERLEAEKSGLSEDIAALQRHVELAEKLVRAQRLPAESYQEFMTVSTSLDSLVLQPKLTLRRPSAPALVKDCSEQMKGMQVKLEEVQSEVLDLSQKRMELAVEEQRLGANRSLCLQELAASRSRCDELLIQKEKLESEVSGLEELLEFWRERNAESEAAMESAMVQLGSFRQEKDARAVQLLEELQGLYTILDEASEILREQVSK